MLILRCAVAITLLVIAVVNYDRLTKIDMRALVDGAGSTAAAVAVIIGVYAVKSVLFIIPASMIYISVGMAFPTPSAIAINLAGIALEITATYLLGWFLGGEYVEKRLKGSKAGDTPILASCNWLVTLASVPSSELRRTFQVSTRILVAFCSLSDL